MAPNFQKRDDVVFKKVYGESVGENNNVYCEWKNEFFFIVKRNNDAKTHFLTQTS